jgi:TolB-like protein
MAGGRFQCPGIDINGKFKEKQNNKSIAVLPFVNMSNDPEQEYFSDGIAEEIINSLTHLKDLNVAGRHLLFNSRKKSRPAPGWQKA